MTTQTDLFASTDISANVGCANRAPDTKTQRNATIAIPCGFRDRTNGPCRRLGNWPVMLDGKQMTCRDRPMVHCDPACFKAEITAPQYGTDDDDVVWEDRVGDYDVDR